MTSKRKTHPATPETAHATNTKALLQAMESRTAELRMILDTETLALSRSDISGFFALQDRKADMAKSWHSALVDIAAARHENANPLDPATKAKLESLRIEMAETVRRNRTAIERSSRSMNRLSDRIMTHARRAAEEKSRVSYSAAGQIRSDAKRALSMGISESA